jgi:hypothetical protein
VCSLLCLEDVQTPLYSPPDLWKSCNSFVNIIFKVQPSNFRYFLWIFLYSLSTFIHVYYCTPCPCPLYSLSTFIHVCYCTAFVFLLFPYNQDILDRIVTYLILSKQTFTALGKKEPANGNQFSKPPKKMDIAIRCFPMTEERERKIDRERERERKEWERKERELQSMIKIMLNEDLHRYLYLEKKKVSEEKK